MSLIWRFVLIVYNLIFMSIGGLLISAAVGLSNPLVIMDQAFASAQNRMISGSVGIFLVLTTIILLAYLLRRTSLPDSVELSNADIGIVSISITAIKNFILKIVKQIDGVKEVKSQVRKGDGGVNISLHIIINPEKNIPELSALTQNKVKEYMENVVGLKVTEIKILVDDMNSAVK